MAEDTIEISSDESDVEDGSITRSTHELQNNAIKKEEPPSESSMCANCNQEFPDINNHLSNSRACFFPLTKGYWKKRQGEEKLCKICLENLKDKLKLKEHCFQNEGCRDIYIMHYLKKIPCPRKATVVSADTDVKFELPAPISIDSRIERTGDIPQSINERGVAVLSRTEVNNRKITAPVSSAEKCVSNVDQRHNVSSENMKGTTCLADDSKFDSKKPMHASNNCKPQQKTGPSYNAAPSSSSLKVGHPESSLKRNNELHTLPGASGSFSRNQDTRTPTRVTLAVKPSVGVSVTNNTEAMSCSAPDIVDEKRPTKRHTSSNLTCERCKKQFATSDNFLLHTMKKCRCFSHYETEDTGVSVPYCFKCKRSFQNCKQCIKHECVGPVKYQCSLCDKIFPSIYSLRNHESSTHKRK